MNQNERECLDCKSEDRLALLRRTRGADLPLGDGDHTWPKDRAPTKPVAEFEEIDAQTTTEEEQPMNTRTRDDSTIDLEEVQRLRGEGSSAKDIARVMGVKTGRIYQALVKLGLNRHGKAGGTKSAPARPPARPPFQGKRGSFDGDDVLAAARAFADAKTAYLAAKRRLADLLGREG